MITSPNENVALTVEQLQQIAVVQTRLENLQKETLIASTNLMATQNDLERILKEKNYQDFILSDLTVKINELTSERASITEDIATAKVTLSSILEESKNLSDKNAALTIDCDERLNQVKAKELACAEKESELYDRQTVIEFRENEITAIIEDFNKWSKSIPWK